MELDFFKPFLDFLLAFSLLLCLYIFVKTLFGYRKLLKMVKYDQERIEKGDSVLLLDSVLYKALQYSSQDFSQSNTTDPFNIFDTFNVIKGVHTISQFAIFLGMIQIVILIIGKLMATERTSNVSAFIGTIIPAMGCVLISFMMILYVNQFYNPLFVNQAYEKIKESQGKLDTVHTKITQAVSPAADAEFYGWLTSETLDSLHTKLTENGPTAETLTKRLVTLSLRDYFMKEVPDYTNSPVRNLFVADASRRITNPGIYVRIDCTQLVQNYAYKYDAVLKEINKNTNVQTILTNVSTVVSEINQAITDFRLSAEPTLSLVETYFRAASMYLFFVAFVGIAFFIAWYNLGCYLNFIVAWIKYIVLWLWGHIKYLFKKDKSDKEEYFEKLTNSRLAVTNVVCNPPKPESGVDGTASDGAEKPTAAGKGNVLPTAVAPVLGTAESPHRTGFGILNDFAGATVKAVGAFLPK